MPDFTDINEKIHFTLKELKNGSTKALNTLFNLYAERLFYYALKFVNSKEIAEEVVQDVFIAIWESRNELSIQKSLDSYLFTSVKNRSISYLRKKIANLETRDLSLTENSMNNSTNEISIEYTELENEIQQAIDALPERCKIIFTLSRNSGLTYKQIAAELDISAESVKTQIGIALKRLKLHLEKFGF